MGCDNNGENICHLQLKKMKKFLHDNQSICIKYHSIQNHPEKYVFKTQSIVYYKIYCCIPKTRPPSRIIIFSRHTHALPGVKCGSNWLPHLGLFLAKQSVCVQTLLLSLADSSYRHGKARPVRQT